MNNVQIKRYITEIRKEVTHNYETGRDVERWVFVGDGGGDFEKYGDSTTKQCLENYIKHCKEQIDLAEVYLRMME
jgi:hypothetical protein